MKENYKEIYELWTNDTYFDEETRNELRGIGGHEKEIEERFYRELEFGTGGLRGIIGAGTNRMNLYTVRKASQGVAGFVKDSSGSHPKVVIAYDSRYMSPEFAMEAAKVFACNGIKTYLFDELRPTPELSFAVRHLGCTAGVVVTASHNPKEYNGYKVYGSDGGQLSIEGSNACIAKINEISDIRQIKVMDEDEGKACGLINIIGKEVDDAYMSALKKLSISGESVKRVADTFKIVYTPLHGAGNKSVRRILNEIGFKHVVTVKEQEEPDPAFSTVKSPNPEERAAFDLAIELAARENVDLIIGTDPDSDRVGVVVRTEADYKVLTGNQTGVLLCEYILSAKKENDELPSNGFIVKTIVTTELVREITAHYGVETVECLTGFKFIGEQIQLRDECGEQKFLFGFEESYGCLAGTDVRDKDAVVASMLIAEMAAWYKLKGMSLYDALTELYKKYGYSKEGIKTFTLQGKEGLTRIEKAMETLRRERHSVFGAFKVNAIRDYKEKVRLDLITGNKSVLELPESNVLYYELDGKKWFCIRPSGTEPKIKVYFGVAGSSEVPADNQMDLLQKDVIEIIEEILFNG